MKKFTNGPRYTGKRFNYRDDRRPSRFTRRYTNFENQDLRVDATADVLKTFEMRRVTRRPYEDNEQLMKRFKRVVENSGVIGELKKREFYQSPGQKRREKVMKAKKRARKKKAMMRRFED